MFHNDKPYQIGDLRHETNKRWRSLQEVRESVLKCLKSGLNGNILVYAHILIVLYLFIYEDYWIGDGGDVALSLGVKQFYCTLDIFGTLIMWLIARGDGYLLKRGK